MRNPRLLALVAALGLAAGLAAVPAHAAGSGPAPELTPVLKVTPAPTLSLVTANMTFNGLAMKLVKGKAFVPFGLKYDDTAGLTVGSTDLGCNATVKLSTNPTVTCTSGVKLKFSDFTPRAVTMTMEH